MALANSVNATAGLRPGELVGGDLALAAAQVLHERVSGGQCPFQLLHLRNGL